MASRPLRVLMVEDLEDDVLLISHELRRGGYDLTFERVDTPAAMRAALVAKTWDVVIADYSMPQFDGLAALELLHDSGLDLPFIIVSGTIGEDSAVAAMKAGAHDYVMKDNLARLVPAVERELQEAEARLARRRSDKLLWVLNQAALVMEKALTPDEIFSALAQELRQVGLDSLLMPCDDDHHRLFTKYLASIPRSSE